MQFTLVVTATKTRKVRTKPPKRPGREEHEKCCSCRLFWETELWVRTVCCSLDPTDSFQALSTTILLQDGPFLCLRLGLIIHYKIISQSNIFFTTKNFLVVLLQLYRVCVIIVEHRKRQRLNHSHEKNTISQLANQHFHAAILLKKPNGGRKRRPGTTPEKSNGTLALQSSSTSQLRPEDPTNMIDLLGDLDPFPRREPSTTSLIPLAPPLPPPRPSISHSKSLTAVGSADQKICTEV